MEKLPVGFWADENIEICFLTLLTGIHIYYIGPVRSGAPNKKIVQKHLNIALLNVF